MAELEKLIGEIGIDEDSHVVVVPAGVQRDRFRLRRARLLDAEGRGRIQRCRSSTAALPPGRRRGYPVETGASKPSPKIFTATLNKSLLADAREVEAIERNGGATLIDARPAIFFAGKEKAPASQGLWPHSGRDQSRQRDASTIRRPTG